MSINQAINLNNCTLWEFIIIIIISFHINIWHNLKYTGKFTIYHWSATTKSARGEEETTGCSRMLKNINEPINHTIFLISLIWYIIRGFRGLTGFGFWFPLSLSSWNPLHFVFIRRIQYTALWGSSKENFLQNAETCKWQDWQEHQWAYLRPLPHHVRANTNGTLAEFSISGFQLSPF